WNLVFIQFNANPDGTFSPLPAKHVDTGMGFERVTSIIQGTKNFSDFAHAKISNYETDIFRPIFDELEKMSGHRYGCTLPVSGSTGDTEEEKIDVAFRVIADHIRTLSFAIADGIQPGNTDRNYVLRRILRRAVKYGRTLGFHKPFFYQLVDVLARTMGDVFPEIRAKQKHVEEVLKREEEAFNRTLDKGIALFESEAARILGSARVSRAGDGVPPSRTSDARYAKRRLPHFELPWAIYAVTLSTHERRVLSPAARGVVLDSFRHFHGQRYDLLAICVMPDHVHLLLRPLPKEHDVQGESVFWALSEIMHSVKSFTAHEINKLENTEGAIWEKELFDRYVRSDHDLEEKFQYILRNPWDAGLVNSREDYPWVWTPDDAAEEKSSSRRDAATNTRDACAPRSSAASGVISGAFAFRLYDEQGFPLDLTELLARERGLTVDKAGFETLMEEQRARARAAQKREIISVSNIDAAPTQFIGYDALTTPATVLDVVEVKGKTAVILDVSTCYAEMGGQVGDTGEIEGGGALWNVVGTQKTGATWLHFLAESDAPAVGASVTLTVDAARRAAIARHHTVTHLLHWALHRVVSPEIAQKGSFVGPDKLTFDFNSGALTPQQIRDIERIVNEKIVENAPVSWTEVPYADIRSNLGIKQFFGDKYGDVVRVVQIGGDRNALNGYSMELCGGTHVRATGEIGLFRIVSEAAIAAGVRRIEAVAGLEAYDVARAASDRLVSLAAKLNAPMGELEKKLDALLSEQKELQKQLKAVQQRQAADTASALMAKAETLNGTPAIIANLGAVEGDTLQAVADALKGKFAGVVVLVGAAEGNVALAASVSPEFVKQFQAGKIIQTLAPIVGGKGGGRPDFARGAGKDAAQLDAALGKARALLGS
ncbi:MAG: alanine--tRNA ligase-related protein, partial [Verrucomicrobia bacterium]|nr:alanine--tRNA ligase-related protein [Verrucomicrobiota bacterium]